MRLRSTMLLHGTFLVLTAVLFAGCPFLFPNVVVVTPAEATIEVGKTVDLDANSTRTEENYIWASDNESVATVNPKGVVTGVAAGQTLITATGEESGTSGVAVITVEPVPEQYDTPTVQSRQTVTGEDGVPATVLTLDSGKQVVLDDPEYIAEYADRSPDLSQKRMSMKELAEEALRQQKRPSAARVSLGAMQTDIRDQQDRGTCVAHATLAALEAAYNRAGYGKLDLSEQFMQHLGKTAWLHDFTANDQHVRTRNGWENQLGLGGGGNIYGSLPFLTFYRVCTEADAPYQHSSKPGHGWRSYGNANQDGDDPRVDWRERSGGETQAEVNGFNMIQDPITIQIPTDYTLTPLPQQALENAIYGITNYQTVPGGRLDDVTWYEEQLAANREVIFGCNFVSDTQDEILYPRDKNEDEGDSWHAMLMVGYDRSDASAPFFIVKNSWGESGFIKMSYDWVGSGKDGRITQAACITGVAQPDPNAFQPQWYVGRWTLVYDGQAGTLDIHRNSGYFEPDKLGGEEDYRLGTFFDSSGLLYRVNGTIADDGRIEFYIDFNNPNLDYETRTGLRFRGDLERGGTTLMAGVYRDASGVGSARGFYATKAATFNANTSYTAPSYNAFLGEWDIYSPVVAGSVEIRSIDTGAGEFDGRYNWSGGWIAMDGTVDPNSQLVTFTLPDVDGGIFTGYVHADAPGIISGTLDRNGDFSSFVLVRGGPATETIEILEPDNGDVFQEGAGISLEAEVLIDGLPEPNALVIWTDGGPYDAANPNAHRIIGNGVTSSTKLGAGSHDIYATYAGSETVIDMVTITVTSNASPTVTISQPQDGAFFQDLTTNPPFVPVQFSGSATDAGGTALTGSSLQWQYRREGDTTWTDAATGGSVTMDLRDDSCSTSYYDVRLKATDGSGNEGFAVIRVGVVAFFC